MADQVWYTPNKEATKKGLTAQQKRLLRQIGSSICDDRQPRSADFTLFRSAKKLELLDIGLYGGDLRRSATVSDPQAIRAVYEVLRSMADDWEPVPWTPPALSLTLVALAADKNPTVDANSLPGIAHGTDTTQLPPPAPAKRPDGLTETDWFWLEPPRGKDGEACLQMKFPAKGTYCKYVSKEDFRRLMKILGAADWRWPADDQRDGKAVKPTAPLPVPTKP